MTGFGAVLLLLLATWPAVAQVTTCYGTDNCTRVTPYGSEKMSVEAARNHARTNVKGEIVDIGYNCSLAVDPAKCRTLVQELQAQFRLR